MSIATVVGGIGAFIGGGFGIGKIFGAFKKLGKIKKIIKELIELRKEGAEAYGASKALIEFIIEATKDKDITPEEGRQAAVLGQTAKREILEAKAQLDELIELFK